MYDTNILGQDPYTGQVAGMHPATGALIAAGGATAVSEGLQWLAGGTKWAERSGLLATAVGLAASGAMYFMGHRGAGVTGAAAVMVTHGVSAVIDMFMPSPQEAVATMAGLALQELSGVELLSGVPQVNQLSGPGVEVLSGPFTPNSVASHFGATVI